MVHIIIKGSKKSQRSRRGSRPNEHVGPWSMPAQRQYAKVSKENREDFKNEKRVQELHKQGFNEAAISGMTLLSESSVKSMMKKTGKNIILDGKY